MSQSAAPISPDDPAFEGAFVALKSAVDDRLGALLPVTGTPSQAARHSLLAPGKRLRAVMTLLAARQCGAADAVAMDAACAVEMVHTASLVFDDLPAMDNAPLRRGLQTPHVLFGDDVAILAGIGLLNGAYGVVAHCPQLDATQKVAITQILADAIGWSGLVQGQALDLESSGPDGGAPLADIHHGKTGVLFVAAALSGAIAAGAPTATHANLTRYGRELGLAYQAFDDVLDQVADDAVAGKSTGRDAGKQTAVFRTAAKLDVAAGQRATADEVTRALAHARTHLTAAKTAISTLPGATQDPAPLAALADYIDAYFDKTFAACDPS